MSLIDEFQEFMQELVLIEKRTGQDRYNEPIYSGPEQVPAMISRSNKLVRGNDGEEHVSNLHIYLARRVGIKPEDRITLPDGSQPQIISIDAPPAIDHPGPDHEVIHT